MITLGQHFDIHEAVSNDALSEYLDQFPPSERVSIMRKINDNYPLKMGDSVSEYVSENFLFYDNVFDLVLGQFIMIEKILTGKFKFKKEHDMDLELAMFLFRPKDEHEFDNEDPEKEKQIRQSILDIPVQDFYNALNKFLNNRDLMLFKKFSGVFYDSSGDQAEEEGKDEIQGNDIGVDFNQQWYWYNIVRTLAHENILIYDQIYMLKMSVVLPEMSYLAQRNKVESANRRAQAALNRL